MGQLFAPPEKNRVILFIGKPPGLYKQGKSNATSLITQ